MNISTYKRAVERIERFIKEMQLDIDYVDKYYDVHIFEQLWGNTSTYRESFGGEAMTYDYTIVLTPIKEYTKIANKNIVLFEDNGYAIDINNKIFEKDLQEKNIAGMSTFKIKYKD